MTSGVIFDCDGVLVDSEPIAAEAWRHRLFADLAVFADAADTVATLALLGVPLAVASSSRAGELRHKLELVELARYFQVAVGGDEVANGKPAPDLYIEAALRLGVSPGACLAVEDSAPGAAAAVAAGMRVVVVRRDGSAVAGHTTVSSLDADSIRLWLGM